MKLQHGLGVIVLGALMLGAASVPAQSEEKPAPVTEEEIQTLVRGCNEFGFKLYQKLAKDNDSFVFSPLSVYELLLLFQTGASGQTYNELSDALGTRSLGNKSPAVYHALKSAICKQANDGNFLNSHLRLWAESSELFRPAFLAQTKQCFGGDFQNLRLGTQKSIEVMNQWIEERTNKRITNLIDFKSFPANPTFVVANALHFQSIWQTAFNPKFTHSAFFYPNAKESRRVEMMSAYDPLCLHASTSSTNIYKIPLKNKQLAFVCCLPRKRWNLSEVDKNLSSDLGAKSIAKLRLAASSITCVNIPRFATEFKTDLIPICKQIGISQLSQQPNLARMLTVNVMGVYFRHGCHFGIREDGVEGAAASVGATAISDTSLDINEPFVYSVIDKTTGLVVFLGKFV
jgi:serine protease inhibitor